MFDSPGARHVAVALVAVTMVLAGCNAFSGGAQNAAPGGNQTGSGPFQSGESYTYQVTLGGYPAAAVTWQVTDASSDAVTVNVTFAPTNGTARTRTVTAPPDQIMDQLQRANDTGFSAAVLRYPARAVAGQDLSRGASWTFSPDEVGLDGSQVVWSRARANVTGTETVAGVQCRDVHVTFQSNQTVYPATYCVKQDWPLVLSATSGNGTGRLDIRLSSYDRP
ncbi:MAG: hypothetical protein ABEJ31_12975 [Haloarculaceae archaeon]